MPANWARKIRGRKVRGEESPYSRPEIQKLQSAFKEALPFLMFRSASRISEEDRLIQSAINTARSLGVPEEKIQEKLKERGVTWRTPQDLSREIYRLRAYTRRTETNGGSDCSEYKEILESDLLSHLQNGWRIVHTNSNGKVIVSKGT